MPGKDGTGPMGIGDFSGRGLGPCGGVNRTFYGAGFGPGGRRGLGSRFGGRFFYEGGSSQSEKELLKKQKDFLKDRIEAIDKQLEEL